jgi:hypothetical protein
MQKLFAVRRFLSGIEAHGEKENRTIWKCTVTRKRRTRTGLRDQLDLRTWRVAPPPPLAAEGENVISFSLSSRRVSEESSNTIFIQAVQLDKNRQLLENSVGPFELF